MRKVLNVCLYAIVFIASAAECQPFLVDNAKSPYTVVLPEASTEIVFPPGNSIQYAAEFLVDYIEQATGCRLPIMCETDFTNKTPVISLGPTRLAKKAIGSSPDFAPEECLVQTLDGNVIICGEIDARGLDRGTLFGVYKFLEKVIGVRWYFGDDRWYSANMGTVIPKHQKVVLHALNIRDAPAFRQHTGGVSYDSWPIKLQKRWHPVLRFGDTRAHGTANHTQLGWTDLYGKTHPEYFAVSTSGRRQINFRNKHRSYICLTNPDVLTQMLANIEEFDRTGVSKGAFGSRNPDPHCVYFCPNDGMTTKTVCHCEGCKPWLRPEGEFDGHASELVFQFVYRYAAAIQERWPGRRLAVLAYTCFKIPPQKTTVPDNVDITYVSPPIQYAMDPIVYRNHSATLRQWSDLLGNDPSRLNLWMNVHSPNGYTSFVPTMYHHTLSRWLREHRNLVSGYFINGGNPHLRRLGPRGIWAGIQSFPMAWLQSQLIWDPNRDPDVLLEQYCQDMFGQASNTMLEFYQLISARWEGFYKGELDMDELAFIHNVRYPPPVLEQFRELLDRAAEETEVDTMPHRRIIFFRDKIYSHFLDESLRYHDWSNRVASYECLKASASPVINGVLDDASWDNIPTISLVRRQWGEPSDRTTEVKMLHDGEHLYISAKLHKQANTALTNEQFWVQIARTMAPVSKIYATNIDKRWGSFIEMRISADGTLRTHDQRSKSTQAAAGIDGDILTIEARIALADLGVDLDKNRQLRLQLTRTWGDWKRCDLWCPTLAHISDFPTYRFGLLQLKQGHGKRKTSSLE